MKFNLRKFAKRFHKLKWFLVHNANPYISVNIGKTNS